MLAILDYGMGNLHSVQKGIERVGGKVVVTAEAAALDKARGLVLPGVGAFGDAMEALRAGGLIEPLRRQVETGKPLLGICLGMQLLFEESEEMGRHRGLGVLRGRVVRFAASGDGKGLRVPHVGWNQLLPRRPSPLLASIPAGSYAYFVHSYYVLLPEDQELVLATTHYGRPFASMVGQGAVFGVQFHPEKSQEVGLRILRNYVEFVGSG